MAFAPAYREQVRLRLALMGPAKTGKTFTSFATAAAISYEIRKRGGRGAIAVADSEQRSAHLYAMSRAERGMYDSMSVDDGYEFIKRIRKFPIDVALLTPPFTPASYIGIMQDAVKDGYDVTILDSISHAWAGTGGLLDRKGREEDRGANSFTAWRKITPEHNAFVDEMLATGSHLIVTMRMKTAHAIEFDETTKKNKIVELGLEEIQRDGVRYEFTLFGMMDHEHTLTVGGSRLDGVIHAGDKFERPGDAFGRRIYGWVNDGDEPAPRVEPPALKPAYVRQEPLKMNLGIEQLYSLIDAAPDEVALKVHVPLITRLATEFPAYANQIKAKYAARKAEIKALPPTSGGSSLDAPPTPASSDESSPKSTRVDPPHLAVVEVKVAAQECYDEPAEGYET